MHRSAEGGASPIRNKTEQRGTKRKPGSVSSLLDRFENNKKFKTPDRIKPAKPKPNRNPSQQTNLSIEKQKFLSIINKLSEINPELETTIKTKPTPPPDNQPLKPKHEPQPNTSKESQTKPTYPQVNRPQKPSPEPQPSSSKGPQTKQQSQGTPKKTKPPAAKTKPRKNKREDPNQTTMDKYFKKQESTQNQEPPRIVLKIPQPKLKFPPPPPTKPNQPPPGPKIKLKSPPPPPLKPNQSTPGPEINTELQELAVQNTKADQPTTSDPNQTVKPTIREPKLIFKKTSIVNFKPNTPPQEKPNQDRSLVDQQEPNQDSDNPRLEKSKTCTDMNTGTKPSPSQAKPAKGTAKKKLEVLPDIKRFLFQKKVELKERKKAKDYNSEPTDNTGPELQLPESESLASTEPESLAIIEAESLAITVHNGVEKNTAEQRSKPNTVGKKGSK